jgi:hypothetical protein
MFNLKDTGEAVIYPFDVFDRASPSSNGTYRSSWHRSFGSSTSQLIGQQSTDDWCNTAVTNVAQGAQAPGFQSIRNLNPHFGV